MPTRLCPECGERLSEHSPFDPELIRRGLFRAWRAVYACPMCGYLDWDRSSAAWSLLPAG
jgi:uncharacterized protein with PIN domain